MLGKRITYYIKRLGPGSYHILIHGLEVKIKPGDIVMSNYGNYEDENYYLKLYLSLPKNYKRKIKFTRQKLEKSVFYNEMIPFDPITSPYYTYFIAPYSWVYPIINERSKVWNGLIYDKTMYPENRGDEKVKEAEKLCLVL